MKSLRIAVAIALATLLSLTSAVAPSFAARVYNLETNMWEEATVVQQRGRRGSPIKREIVAYSGNYKPGTIIVETSERRLYYVLPDGQAIKYGVGVGRDGFRWSGQHRITARPVARLDAASRHARAFPTCRPHARRPGQPPAPAPLYRLDALSHSRHVRAWTIGQAVSSGCIRMTNEDVIDLYDRVRVGALVVVNH